MCSFATGACVQMCVYLFIYLCASVSRPLSPIPLVSVRPSLSSTRPSPTLSYDPTPSYPIRLPRHTYPHPPMHSSRHPSIRPSVRPSGRPCIHPSICLSVSVCLFSCPPTYLMSTCPSAYLPTYLASQLAVYPSIHRSIIYLCICLFLYLSD